MRKDVTLGMTIGGGLLAVALVGIIAVSHKDKDRHGGVETTLMNNSGGGAGDVAGDTAASEQGAAPKADDASSKTPTAKTQTEDKSTEKATPAKNTAVAKADGKKDAITDALLFGGNGGAATPLIGSSQTPDPNAGNTSPAAEPAAASEGTTTPAAAPEHKPTVEATVAPPMDVKPSAVGGAKVAPKHEVAPSKPAEVEPAAPSKVATAADAGTANKSHTHTVQKGETFSTIAAAAYGSANYYPYIMRANPKVDAKALKPGMVLVLPDASEVKTPAAPVTTADAKTAAAKGEATPAAHKTGPAPIDATREYRVVSGDSLNRIAIRLYGKQDMTDKLYEANKETIGDNPAVLKPGMVLKLPQPPVVAATTSAR